MSPSKTAESALAARMKGFQKSRDKGKDKDNDDKPKDTYNNCKKEGHVEED